MTVTVKNRQGHGYKKGESFLKYWEKESGHSAYFCANVDCVRKAVCGGHVYKINSGSNPTYYIVPLCNSCNQTDFEKGFQVEASDLIEAPTQD